MGDPNRDHENGHNAKEPRAEILCQVGRYSPDEKERSEADKASPDRDAHDLRDVLRQGRERRHEHRVTT
jgi:hypothetical protein